MDAEGAAGRRESGKLPPARLGARDGAHAGLLHLAHPHLGAQ